MLTCCRHARHALRGGVNRGFKNGLVYSSLRFFRTSNASRNEIKVIVNDEEIDVPGGSTVLQACERAGVYIPRFCYHDRLSIAGNCRMCLVEVEKSPKPVASCAMPVMPGMNIKTDTTLVHRAREGVMEFLLANHPLDCPICDQGGECDLQDQSLQFGADKGRFMFEKRTVEDKDIGPLVKTVMTRCIHCTRCVRFTDEIAGVQVLGTTGRGQQMEIGCYDGTLLDTELSGNVIDLCPVGALTSQPYAFNARPWELEVTESIDVMDAVGSNINLQSRGADILRVIPRLNEEVNEEWISDKTRFSYDGISSQRLDVPMLRQKRPDGGSEFVEINWKSALLIVADKLKTVNPAAILGVAGDHACLESMVALKDLLNSLGCNNTVSSQTFDSTDLSADFRAGYLMNTTIMGIEDADVLLLVGTNPRMEAPLVNARIRKAWLHWGLKVSSIGPNADLTYDVDHLGNDLSMLQEIAEGSHPMLEKLQNASRPMILVGMGTLDPKHGHSVLSTINAIKEKVPNIVIAENESEEGWNGVSILHTAASRVGALDIGFVQGVDEPETPKLVYLLSADNEALKDNIPNDAFVVYQGSHGDIGANLADLILPGATYTEKSATYVNMEGRVQVTKPVNAAVNNARDDWTIIRALSEVAGAKLGYDNLDQVRQRLREIAPHFNGPELQIPSLQSVNISEPEKLSGPIQPYLKNFFMTDPISRNSKTMAECTKRLPTSRNSYL